MLHRIRTAFEDVRVAFDTPVEVGETYVGGKRRNMSTATRKELEGAGRGPVTRQPVVGMKGRKTSHVVAKVIDSIDGETLQGFVDDNASPDAALSTDDASAYRGTGREHDTVKHTAGEYVTSPEGATGHTNGVGSLWSMLKRTHKGV